MNTLVVRVTLEHSRIRFIEKVPTKQLQAEVCTSGRIQPSNKLWSEVLQKRPGG